MSVFESMDLTKVPLEDVYGCNIVEKTLNVKLAAYVRNGDFREVAKCLASYVEYRMEDVKFKDIINPAVYAKIHGNIKRLNNKDGLWYGYYKESEEQWKYFLVNGYKPIANNGIVIVDHTKKAITRFTLQHTAIVKCKCEPNVGDVSIACGYHPAGYGCSEASISYNGNGTYIVEWRSGSSCD